MQKIPVSACLLGERVRYDAGDVSCLHPVLRGWAAEGRLVQVCPEVAGGLAVPRPPAQIRGPSGGPALLAGTARVVPTTTARSRVCGAGRGHDGGSPARGATVQVGTIQLFRLGSSKRDMAVHDNGTKRP